MGILLGVLAIKGDASLVAGKVPRGLAYPLEMGILRGFLATAKVAPPLSLPKYHKLLLTLFIGGVYETFW